MKPPEMERAKGSWWRAVGIWSTVVLMLAVVAGFVVLRSDSSSQSRVVSEVTWFEVGDGAPFVFVTLKGGTLYWSKTDLFHIAFLLNNKDRAVGLTVPGLFSRPEVQNINLRYGINQELEFRFHCNSRTLRIGNASYDPKDGNLLVVRSAQSKEPVIVQLPESLTDSGSVHGQLNERILAAFRTVLRELASGGDASLGPLAAKCLEHIRDR